MTKQEIIVALREIVPLPEGPERKAKFEALCQTDAPCIVLEALGDGSAEYLMNKER